MGSVFEENRVGKFSLGWEQVEDVDTTKRVLEDIVIVEATSHFAQRTIDYIGYCKRFDKVKEGLEIPTYDIMIVEYGYLPARIISKQKN